MHCKWIGRLSLEICCKEEQRANCRDIDTFSKERKKPLKLISFLLGFSMLPAYLPIQQYLKIKCGWFGGYADAMYSSHLE